MKAVLVIDMPNNCEECNLIYLQGHGESICDSGDWSKRPSWCPLRPLPQKDESDWEILSFMNKEKQNERCKCKNCKFFRTEWHDNGAIEHLYREWEETWCIRNMTEPSENDSCEGWEGETE